jgi:DNA polymerase V
MADLHSLDLVKKNLLTDQIVLTIGYDIDNLKNGRTYDGEITTDRYGRKTPKHAHGTINLRDYTSSTEQIVSSTIELFERIIDKNLLVRRINLVFGRVITESRYKKMQKVPEN